MESWHKRPDCTRLHLRVLEFLEFSGRACPWTPLACYALSFIMGAKAHMLYLPSKRSTKAYKQKMPRNIPGIGMDCCWFKGLMKKVRTFQVQLSAFTQNDEDDSASTDLMNLNLSELSGCHFEGIWNALNLASYSTPCFSYYVQLWAYLFLYFCCWGIRPSFWVKVYMK